MIKTYEVDVPARKKILYDISDLICSSDMRKLVQEAEPELDPEDVEQLILYSNKSLEEKIVVLRSLAEVARKVTPKVTYDREASQMADLLELCLKQIYSPEERVLYIWRKAGSEDFSYHDSFQELLETWGDCDIDGSDENDCEENIVSRNERLSCDHVTQLSVGDKETREILSFTMQTIGGRYVIRAVNPNRHWLRKQGVSIETVIRFGAGIDLNILGIKLPECTRWKYQTPSMRTPVYGTLSQKRRQDHWVFTTCEGIREETFDSLDTDYSGDMFSVLDWMELAPAEELVTDSEEELPFV